MIPPSSPKVRFQAFLDKHPEDVATAARNCMEILRACLPGATQSLYDDLDAANYNTVKIGVGPSERPAEAIFCLVVFSNHIDLRFLQETGPTHIFRDSYASGNIRLSEPADLNSPEVSEMIAAAVKSARTPIDPAKPGTFSLRSVSKKYRRF